jgi:hypothetical protein
LLWLVGCLLLKRSFDYDGVQSQREDISRWSDRSGSRGSAPVVYHARQKCCQRLRVQPPPYHTRPAATLLQRSTFILTGMMGARGLLEGPHHAAGRMAVIIPQPHFGLAFTKNLPKPRLHLIHMGEGERATPDPTSCCTSS